MLGVCSTALSLLVVLWLLSSRADRSERKTLSSHEEHVFWWTGMVPQNRARLEAIDKFVQASVILIAIVLFGLSPGDHDEKDGGVQAFCAVAVPLAVGWWDLTYTVAWIVSATVAKALNLGLLKAVVAVGSPGVLLGFGGWIAMRPNMYRTLCQGYIGDLFGIRVRSWMVACLAFADICVHWLPGLAYMYFWAPHASQKSAALALPANLLWNFALGLGSWTRERCCISRVRLPLGRTSLHLYFRTNIHFPVALSGGASLYPVRPAASWYFYLYIYATHWLCCLTAFACLRVASP